MVLEYSFFFNLSKTFFYLMLVYLRGFCNILEPKLQNSTLYIFILLERTKTITQISNNYHQNYKIKSFDTKIVKINYTHWIEKYLRTYYISL